MSAEASTIPEDIMQVAAELANAAIRNYERNEPANVARDAIAAALAADRERSAALVDEMLNDPRFTKEVRARLGLVIAARAIRRGRHLTDSERLENVLLWAKAEGDAA